MTNNSDKLIKYEIKGRQVTYYLTTEEDLHNIKSNSILCDISSLLASLCVGGIISVILTNATGINLEPETINVLRVLRYVFTLGAAVCAFFTGYFYYQSFMIINKIKGSGAVKSLKSGDREEIMLTETTKAIGTEGQLILEILNAEYLTPKARLNVTEELKKMIVDNKLHTIASNEIKGDPDVGVVKKLSIEYKFNGITLVKEFTEGDNVIIP